MREDRRFTNTRQVAAMALAVAALEFFLVRCSVGHGAEWGLLLAAHLAVTAGLAAACYWSPVLRADVRLPLLLTVSTGALGPVGAAGTLATMALSRWYMRNAVPFEEWYRSLFPDTGRDATDDLFQRIAASEPAESGNLAAFADVLAFGSVPQKQALIALISQQFRPAFGPILKRALTDIDSSIRVQAATAMSRLENAFLDRTLQLDLQARENPRDVEALRSLARHYDHYLYSGILDVRREEEVRAQALAAYRRCVDAEPDDLGSRLAAGRLLLRGRRYAEAAEWFDRAMQAGISTPQAALWYMESLFHSGGLSKLRELARNWRGAFESLTDFPADAQEAARLWAGEAPVPAEKDGRCP
jgi:polysaccharide biosynthesis protein PelE